MQGAAFASGCGEPREGGGEGRAEKDGRQGRGGQAVVELVVGLVALLAVFAGLLQVASLALAHARAMEEARRVAAEAALREEAPVSDPHYLHDRTVGADGAAYSRDDGYADAWSGELLEHGVRYARPAELGAFRPNNVVSALADTPDPQYAFGLTHGRESEDVPTLPIVRELLYDAETVNVRADAWMTWTRGLY